HKADKTKPCGCLPPTRISGACACLVRTSGSRGPSEDLLGHLVQTPEANRCVAHPHHGATTLGIGCERRVLEETADKTGHLVLAHCQIDQTVGWVTEGLPIETIITGEKRRPR